jgi:hypothetical protein
MQATNLVTSKSPNSHPIPAPNSPSSSPPPPPQSIAPGQLIQLSIQFTPADAVDDLGALVIRFDDPNREPLEIPLESKLSSAHECELTVSPQTIQYGFVGLGRSQARAVTLENKGFGSCVISQATFPTNPSQVFRLTNALPAGGYTIPSGQTFQLEVSYTPVSGTAFQGVLELTTNDGVTPTFNVNLIGTTGQLCIEALPDPLDFGTIQQNCSSTRQALEVYNICSQTVSVTSIKFGQGTNQPVQEFFIRSAPTTPVTVAFGQSFKLELTYAPRNLGSDTGTLELENNTPGQSPIIVALKGEGVATNDQTDTFQQANRPEIDLLLVIDDSCSMGPKQTSVANNLNTFMQWASQLQVDYHIGVTTTDVRNTPTGANKPTAGCLRGSPLYITPATPNATTAFANNVRVGTTGSAYELGLEASYEAFQSTKLSGCNQGFYRPDAALSIIYIADESDQSPQPTAFYINFFRNLKGVRNASKIRASAIAGGPNDRCADLISSDARYFDVAQQLGGLQISICNANWGQTLSQLGSLTFGYRSQFFLSRPADPSSTSPCRWPTRRPKCLLWMGL